MTTENTTPSDNTEYTPSNPRYPDVKVRLSGEDGNAFAIIGRVTSALRRQARVGPEVLKEFQEEAMSGDYDHLLQTCMRWVDVS